MAELLILVDKRDYKTLYPKYRLIKNNIAPIKSLYAVKLSELILHYEKENG